MFCIWIILLPKFDVSHFIAQNLAVFLVGFYGIPPNKDACGGRVDYLNVLRTINRN